MKEERCFKIADTILELSAEDQYIQEELESFRVTEPFEGLESVRVEIFEVESFEEILQEDPAKLLVEAETISVYETESSFFVRYRSVTSVYGYRLFKDRNMAHVYVTGKISEKDTDVMYSVRDSFFFYLQQKGKIVIHSASFVYENQVWLVSAPSGVGKSTHVSLWKEKEYGIEDFNGDIAACYINHAGEAVAAGLPWCGTSGIYRNEILSLGGILLLKRGTECLARRLENFEAAIRLAARCVTPAWTAKQADINISVADSLTEKVCVGELTATPDERAVKAAKALMDSCKNKKKI